MKVKQIKADQREQWNTLVAKEPSFGLLQSWEWGAFKEQSGWKVFRVAVQDKESLIAGAQLLIRSAPFGIASFAYVPRGPFGDWMNTAVIPLLMGELQRIASNHRVVFLHIEPCNPDNSTCGSILQDQGFQASWYTNQPRATIVVDLSQGLDSLFEQLHQKTRYNIRYASRKGVTMRVGDENDLPMFHRLMQITASRGGFTARSLDYYRDEWSTFSKTGQTKLFIAEYEGEPIAVNMSSVFGRSAAYLHGGSSGEYANLQPNYLIMWEAMRWAHTQGCDSFDLWGVPDEVGISVSHDGSDLPKSDRTDGLWGVYRFKRGFSKNVVLFASAHDYVYSPLLYKLGTNPFFSTDTFEAIATFIDRI